MMIAAISKFEIQNGMEEKVKLAFKNRPGPGESGKRICTIGCFKSHSKPIRNTPDHLLGNRGRF